MHFTKSLFPPIQLKRRIPNRGREKSRRARGPRSERREGYLGREGAGADVLGSGQVERDGGSKYVRSGCTTALNVVPWETDGESVLREAMTNTQTPPHATTVVIPIGVPATNKVANHAERPKKFNGHNFKRMTNTQTPPH
ncbi:hypothetical protein Tco_1376362 [Tanacetum coccineum]